MEPTPTATGLGEVYTTLKANRKRIREAAEDAIRKFLEAQVADPSDLSNYLKNSSTDEISVLLPLQRQTSSSEEGKARCETVNKLLDDLKEFTQLYSLMFRDTCPTPKQYDRALAILAGKQVAQTDQTIEHNCFSHMRITKNKKMEERDADGDGIIRAVQTHDGQGAWTLITGLGSGGMRVVVPGFQTISQWGDESNEEPEYGAGCGLMLRPNLWIGALSWGEKIFIELFLPYLDEEDVSMELITNPDPRLDKPFLCVAQGFEGKGEKHFLEV